VNRRFIRKDATMASKSAILLAAAMLTGCGYTPHDLPDRGVASVNVPVLTRADFVFDAAAPDGSLASGEAARLNAWFAGLDLGYGDSIYVDGRAGRRQLRPDGFAQRSGHRRSGRTGHRPGDRQPDARDRSQLSQLEPSGAAQ
jgi:hypothetical protein